MLLGPLHPAPFPPPCAAGSSMINNNNNLAGYDLCSVLVKNFPYCVSDVQFEDFLMRDLEAGVWACNYNKNLHGVIRGQCFVNFVTADCAFSFIKKWHGNAFWGKPLIIESKKMRPGQQPREVPEDRLVSWQEFMRQKQASLTVRPQPLSYQHDFEPPRHSSPVRIAKPESPPTLQAQPASRSYPPALIPSQVLPTTLSRRATAGVQADVVGEKEDNILLLGRADVPSMAHVVYGGHINAPFFEPSHESSPTRSLPASNNDSSPRPQLENANNPYLSSWTRSSTLAVGNPTPPSGNIWSDHQTRCWSSRRGSRIPSPPIARTSRLPQAPYDPKYWTEPLKSSVCYCTSTCYGASCCCSVNQGPHITHTTPALPPITRAALSSIRDAAQRDVFKQNISKAFAQLEADPTPFAVLRKRTDLEIERERIRVKEEEFMEYLTRYNNYTT